MDPRRRPATTKRLAASIAAALGAFGLGACQECTLRAVVHDRPLISSVEISVDPTGLELAPVEGDEIAPEVESETPLLEGAFSRWGRVGATAITAASPLGDIAGEIAGEGPVQLDPGLGPVDLGYPLLVDLGAGDAPYDDGVETIHAVEVKRGGFSDTVIQVQWREPIHPGWSITGGACLFREQDLSILDGMETARFGWAILGVAGRF